MRVANIIEDGKLAGPQVRIFMVANALQGRVETTVIMPHENSEEFSHRCHLSGVPFIQLPLTRLTKERLVALRYLLFSVFEVFRLARVLKSGGFDVVHVSGGAWQFKGVIASKLVGIRVLWHLNDTSMPGFVRNLFSILSPLADGFIFSSESSKAYYEPLIWKKRRSFVIPAPVDTNLFNPLLGYSGSSEFRSELQNKVVIGTLCNISPIKGLETFIRAASILTRDFDDVFFQVVGPVYKNQKLYFANLLDLCKGLGLSNIEFLGATQDVQAFMSRIDIYVCSSLAESSPMAVWEAMAMEKPVVSTAVGDVPLHVNCGQSGYIVNVNDSVALADSIARLVKDAVLRRKLGAVGRQVAIEKLDLTRCANSHFNAYSETVSDLAGSI